VDVETGCETEYNLQANLKQKLHPDLGETNFGSSANMVGVICGGRWVGTLLYSVLNYK
jgi:hypothetical protein